MPKDTRETQNPSTLRIALLGTRGIPARYGGFETFAEQLSRRLVERGHRVTVYGRCRFWDRWGARASIDDVRVRVTPTLYHKYLETPVHAFTSFLDVVRYRFDAVILCNAANAPFAWMLRIRRPALLINVDGIERNRAKWNRLGKAWYLLGERCAIMIADKVVSDARVIADYYRDTYACESEIIPYGVHPVKRAPGPVLAEFGLAPKRYILYVSRLEPENNALGVIEAYERLETDMPLVIVGDAPYSDSYKKQLRAAAGPRVIFTGYQFGAAYEELQSNCYVYVQATEVGGTHPALVESMSYGNCVIVNGTPENVEVVGDAGRSFAKNDFHELTAQLHELLTRPEIVADYGARASLRVNTHYSWDSVVMRYETLIRDLLPKP